MFNVLFLFSTALLAASAAPTADDNSHFQVVGGSDAKVGEFPYMATLRYGKKRFFCGGSILNSRTIVTSASCLHHLTPDKVHVVVGSIYLDSVGTKYPISKMTAHPDYDNQTGANNIGLVFTSEPIITSSSVGFISLPSSITGAGVNVTLTGWGQTSWPSDNISNTLQKITFATISDDDCKKIYPDSYTDNTVCTLTKKGEGACMADAGTPIADGNVLVGILCGLFPCARGYPDVYTRISSFVSWINDNTQS